MSARRRAPERPAVLSLGSNLGAREENILAAVSRLSNVPGLMLEAVSSLYETSPVDMVTEHLFINAACVAQTAMPPRELLAACKEIEREFGRGGAALPGGGVACGAAFDGATRRSAATDRSLDIDIILYADDSFFEADLQVPHPRFHERLFVLEPLMEIRPGLKVPPSGKTIADLYRSWVGGGWVRKVSARGETPNFLKTKKL